MVARAISANVTLSSRRAFDADFGAFDVEIARRGFEQMTRHRERPLAHRQGGAVRGGAGEHRLARIEAAEAERGRGAVAGGDGDIRHVAAELIGDDLRQHRLGALAHMHRAGKNVDLARRRDAHGDRFERAAPGAFDEIGKPDAEIAAGVRALLLPRVKIVPAGARQRRLLAGRIIAAVEHDLDAAAGRQRRLARHLFRRNEIAAAHLGAIERELARDAVEQPLHGEDALRLAGAAHRRDRHLVGERELDVEPIGRHFIGERHAPPPSRKAH